MKRFPHTVVALLVVLLLTAGEAFSRGFGGGGGARPSMGRSPSFNRSPSMSRPPSFNRPSVSLPSYRPPSSISRPAPRPGISRPSIPSRPDFSPPNIGNRPISRPGSGQFQPEHRPSKSELGNFLDLSRKPAAGGLEDRLESRPAQGNVRDRLDSRPAPPGNIADRRDAIRDRLPAAGIDRPGQGNVRDRLESHPSPGNIADRRDAFRDRQQKAIQRLPDRDLSNQLRTQRKEIYDQRRNRANDIRNNVYKRPQDWFTPDWWRRHPHWGPGPWYRRYPYVYWWRWSTWPGLTRWIVGTWAEPFYYDYGANVVYQDNVVYVNGDEVCTAPEYAEQAMDLADVQPPAADDENVQWKPLGVFALSTGKEEKDPSMIIQLAVNKEGIITGTYYNTISDAPQPIQGAVDRETQRAAWTIGQNKNTVLETGIFNLTEDETPVLVHFGKDNTQTWLMVRLEEPKSGTNPTEAK